MKALSILGTASGVGKSWITTAVCAWLHREGVRVAPFKAQNMSNNAWATPRGAEMARAQAVQAEACGLEPDPAMNPILLKPSGDQGAQLVLNGEARGNIRALGYYGEFDRLWQLVAGALDFWRTRCEVLVMEGAGSPVELNLLDRDLVNLRPVRYLDGRWILVGDVDRGGIYAQLSGTWSLFSASDRVRSLGAIINRFRGDSRLFPDPGKWLAPYAPGLEVLGTVPYRPDLQPEEEDGLTATDHDRGAGALIAWIRFPHVANLTDCQPWWSDHGVRLRWTASADDLAHAQVIVLPGSKNTLADLRWLREAGLAEAVCAAARRGTLVVGICGGYQMLGERVVDLAGIAGDAGDQPGLGLLPVRTEFLEAKQIRQVTVQVAGRSWSAYEIHMGRTEICGPAETLNVVYENARSRGEGVRCGNVWGTYLHGWFEAPEVRQRVADAAGIQNFRPHPVPWAEQRRAIYAQMADHLAASVNLDPVRRYLEI